MYIRKNWSREHDVSGNLSAYADERTWLEILLLGNGYNADKIGRAYHDLA
jgi:hypothetical protein